MSYIKIFLKFSIKLLIFKLIVLKVNFFMQCLNLKKYFDKLIARNYYFTHKEYEFLLLILTMKENVDGIHNARYRLNKI